jgi:hypothetical protein
LAFIRRGRRICWHLPARPARRRNGNNDPGNRNRQKQEKIKCGQA